jgi:hypothetical protein
LEGLILLSMSVRREKLRQGSRYVIVGTSSPTCVCHNVNTILFKTLRLCGFLTERRGKTIERIINYVNSKPSPSFRLWLRRNRIPSCSSFVILDRTTKMIVKSAQTPYITLANPSQILCTNIAFP